MSKKHFPTAPDLEQDFNKEVDELRPPTDAVNWPTHDDLDQLDLQDRALTPGGELEYQVHRQVKYSKNVETTENGVTHTSSEEKELDFEEEFTVAAKPQSRDDDHEQALSADELKHQIEQGMPDLERDFSDSITPDRGGVDR